MAETKRCNILSFFPYFYEYHRFHAIQFVAKSHLGLGRFVMICARVTRNTTNGRPVGGRGRAGRDAALVRGALGAAGGTAARARPAARRAAYAARASAVAPAVRYGRTERDVGELWLEMWVVVVRVMRDASGGCRATVSGTDGQKGTLWSSGSRCGWS